MRHYQHAVLGTSPTITQCDPQHVKQHPDRGLRAEEHTRPVIGSKKGRREQIQTAFFMPYWFASRIVYRRFPLLRPRPTTTSPISPKPSNSSIAGSGTLVTMS